MRIPRSRPGRPKADEPSRRAALLKTATELFRQQGPRKVSIKEICQSAGVSKVTFYKHFEDKTDLTLKLLDEMIEIRKEEFKALLHSKRRFSEKVAIFTQRKIEASKELGDAFVGDILAGTDSRLTKFMQQRQKESLHLSLDFFRMGKREGYINPKCSEEFYLYLLQQINAMAQDPVMLKIYPRAVDRVQHLIEFLLFGLANRPSRFTLRKDHR